MTNDNFSIVERQDRAAAEKKAAKCSHRFRDVRCKGYDVETDTDYRVESCDLCEARRDVTLDGFVLREYLAHLPWSRRKTQDGAFYNDPSVYTPQHDGIDAKLSEDNRPPLFVNLFDRRGGIGGIGD